MPNITSKEKRDRLLFIIKVLRQILAYVQTKNKAVTTKEIADDLGILRNNVSKELNVLVRAGKLSKLAGRPVKYQSLAAETDTLIPQTGSKMPDPAEPVLRPSIFDTMIGQKDSLNITSKEKRDRLLFIIKVLRQHEVLRNFLKQKDPKDDDWSVIVK